MTFDRFVSFASLIAVAVAAGASAVQGYVSWSGRNDYLRSTAVAQLIKACGNFEDAADRYVAMNNRAQYYDFTSSFEVLIMSMAPLSLSGFMVLKQEHEKVSHATNPSMTDQEYWDAVKSSLEPMRANTESQCIKVIFEAIGR